MLQINTDGPEGAEDDCMFNSVGANRNAQLNDHTLRFLSTAVQAWGKNYVLDSLSQMSWKISTTFSGMGCFESAALSAARR